MDTAAWRAKFAGLNPRPIDLTLDRMRAALDRLDHPERSLGDLVHVSGTNGKGGVVAAFEAAARLSGRSIQTYSSPFLWNFEENVRRDGLFADPGPCAQIFAHVWDRCAGIPLTWFEVDTLVAFLHFAQWQAGLTVLECGLGGASDATAVAPRPVAAILTNVGGDHAEYLGTDLDQVALEKAGIAKGAPLYVPEDFAHEVGPTHRVTVGNRHPSLALAQAVLTDCFPDMQRPEKAPAQLGRWMPVPGQPVHLCDVGHNAHAARFLAQRLAKQPGPYRLNLGMLRRKDPEAFLAAFAQLPLFVQPVDLGEQGHPPSAILAAAQAVGLSAFRNQSYITELTTGSHQTVAQIPGLKSAMLG